MTYLAFLLLFVGIPSVLLELITRPRRYEWLVIGVHILLAYIWTTPWDNYLVATGVWGYDPEMVLGIILGWVPLEEYLFFGIMTVLSGCWVVLVLRWIEPRPRLARILALVAIAITVIALALLRQEAQPAGARPLNYLLLILGWVAPVLLLQWSVGLGELVRRWPAWALAALVPAIYLTAADSIPLNAGTWIISREQSTSLFLPGNVPLEEGVFFLMTNLMIAQGTLLANSANLQEKARRLLRRLRPAQAAE